MQVCRRHIRCPNCCAVFGCGLGHVSLVVFFFSSWRINHTMMAQHLVIWGVSAPRVGPVQIKCASPFVVVPHLSTAIFRRPTKSWSDMGPWINTSWYRKMICDKINALACFSNLESKTVPVRMFQPTWTTYKPTQSRSTWGCRPFT